MNCREFKFELHDDGELSPEAREHLEECPACPELADGSGRLPEALRARESAERTDETAMNFEALQDEIEEDRGPLAAFREASRAVRTGVVAAVAAAVALIIFVGAPRPDLPEYPVARFWTVAALFFGLAVGAVAAAFRPIYRADYTSRSVLTGLAGIVGYGILVAALPPPHAVEPFHSAGIGEDLWSAAAECFFGGAMFALPVAVVGWFATRTSRPFLSRGLLLGAGAGVVGYLGLHMHCPLVRGEHLLLGHVTVPVAYALVIGLGIFVFDRDTPM